MQTPTLKGDGTPSNTQICVLATESAAHARRVGKKEGKLSLRVSSPLGGRDTDSIKFRCAAAAPWR